MLNLTPESHLFGVLYYPEGQFVKPLAYTFPGGSNRFYIFKYTYMIWVSFDKCHIYRKATDEYGFKLQLLKATPQHIYTPYEGLNVASQKTRKLGVFGRKFEGSHSPFYCYFDTYGGNEILTFK